MSKDQFGHVAADYVITPAHPIRAAVFHTGRGMKRIPKLREEIKEVFPTCDDLFSMVTSHANIHLKLRTRETLFQLNAVGMLSERHKNMFVKLSHEISKLEVPDTFQTQKETVRTLVNEMITEFHQTIEYMEDTLAMLYEIYRHKLENKSDAYEELMQHNYIFILASTDQECTAYNIVCRLLLTLFEQSIGRERIPYGFKRFITLIDCARSLGAFLPLQYIPAFVDNMHLEHDPMRYVLCMFKEYHSTSSDLNKLVIDEIERDIGQDFMYVRITPYSEYLARFPEVSEHQ